MRRGQINVIIYKGQYVCMVVIINSWSNSNKTCFDKIAGTMLLTFLNCVLSLVTPLLILSQPLKQEGRKRGKKQKVDK